MKVKRKNGLTDKQEHFAQLRAQGKGQLEAYKEAYDGKSPDSMQKVQACALEKTAIVKARIEQLQRQAEAGALMDLKSIAAALADMAADETRPDGVRLKAMDQLTRMQGGYTDSNMTVTGTITLDDKRALFEQMMQE